MNLLRTIKIKELNGELNQLDEKERFFLSLFNDLIQVDIDNTSFLITKNIQYVFEIDIKNGKIFCHDDRVWLQLSRQFQLSYFQTEHLIKKLGNILFDVDFKTVDKPFPITVLSKTLKIERYLGKK